jgi:sigma-E factor negative regulatory protein RseA
MKSKISALMDGELERRESGAVLDAMRGEAEARATWQTFHLIGDSMREAHPLSPGFAARVAARLAEEPTVLAPRPRPFLEQRRWQALSAAASLAAVAFVLSVAFAPQDGAGPAMPSTPAAPVAQTAPQPESDRVLPPDAANDYLLAHQAYSPRNSLQGMAPYVRTVSTEGLGGRR